MLPLVPCCLSSLWFTYLHFGAQVQIKISLASPFQAFYSPFGKHCFPKLKANINRIPVFSAVEKEIEVMELRCQSLQLSDRRGMNISQSCCLSQITKACEEIKYPEFIELLHKSDRSKDMNRKFTKENKMSTLTRFMFIYLFLPRDWQTLKRLMWLKLGKDSNNVGTRDSESSGLVDCRFW